MKKYIQYIFLAFIAGLMSVSCIQELELETPIAENDVVTLVPRVQSFANKYVTKSEYSADEQKISNLTVLIFNADGDFACKKDLAADATSFTLNKSMIAKGDMTNSTVVMLANIELGDLKTSDGVINNDNIKNLTVSKLEASTYTPSIGSVIMSGNLSSGLPMIGGKTGVNLTSSKESQSDIEIGLKMLYAKINLQIAVAAEGSENQYLVDGVKFNMTGCSINNTTHTTTLAIPDAKGQAEMDFLGNKIKDENGKEIIAEADGATLSSYYNSGATSIHSGAEISKGGRLDVTFYILESRFNHGLTDEYITQNIYPWGAANGYESYQQMYKPQLVTAAGSPNNETNGLATNVRLSGKYTDYRGTNWNVDYTVYLGKDNAQNFQVDRNSEYTNIITIKGIRNSSSAATGEGEVWIDHRVNVSLSTNQGADDCVTITRQTLIDSHIEVRPLRVRWDDKRYLSALVFLPRYNNSQIEETKDGINQNWIAIENNDGIRYQDVTKYSDNGKRKYFTTDLIKDLYVNNIDIEKYNNENVIPLKNGDCIWIYIDEYTDINARSCREAEIEVRFYKDSDGNYDSEKYKIIQHPLIPIDGYYIESYEEYLHSYDPEDKYHLGTSPTDYTQQGIVWGFYDDDITQQSILSKSYFTINGFQNSWLDGQIISSDSRYKFEFALSEDEEGFSTVDSDKKQVTFPDTGLEFTRRIAVDAKKNVTIAGLSQAPESAIQYCLSKNKYSLDPDGQQHHIDIHWYLPAIDEMNIILSKGGENIFPGDKYYWTSQPAYEKVAYRSISGEHYLLIENPNYARATDGTTNAKPTNTTYRSLYATGTLSGTEPNFENMPGYHSRTKQNRIRCAYDITGESGAQVTPPDGIGPKTIYMRAKRKDNGGDGYFMQYVPKNAKETSKPTKEFSGKDQDYLYPTSGDLADGKFSYNPSNRTLWITEVTSSREDPVPGRERFTLGQYPGLSAYDIEGPTLERVEWVTGYYTMTESSNWKSDTKTKGIIKEKVVDYNNLKDVKLNKLDGTNGIFSIEFDKGNNTQNAPKYNYKETVTEITETWTRHWMVPDYEHKKENLNETLPAKPFTANSIVGRAGLYESFGEWTVATTDIITKCYKNVEDAKKDALAAATSAAKSKLQKDIDDEKIKNQYDELPAIEYGNPVNVDYDPKSKTSRRITYYGVTCTIDMSATVTFTKTGEKEFWIYKANTGRWYKESDPDWPNTAKGNDTEWPNFYTYEDTDPVIDNDELTLYSGNSFKVSVAQGYVIGGIKVYFSGSNKISGNKYLRLVEYGYNSSEAHPEGMVFVDGNEGYAEWGTLDGVSSITLQLAECTMTEPSWFEQMFGATSTINYTTTPSSVNENIIIEKLEITYMKASKDPDRKSY